MGDSMLYTYLLSAVIALLVQYLIIKAAVFSSLNTKLKKSKKSIDDFLLMQTNILLKIAEKNGISEKELNDIIEESNQAVPNSSWF